MLIVLTVCPIEQLTHQNAALSLAHVAIIVTIIDDLALPSPRVNQISLSSRDELLVLTPPFV
jgi:hypothetical protein